MTHHLEMAHNVILGCFLLFLSFAVLFSFQLQYTGMATTVTQVFIVNSSPANCTFTVGAGYNIISIPCISSVSVANVTNSTEVWAIYSYSPSVPDKWQVYNPNLPWYVVSDLTALNRQSGYIVIMNSSANVSIEGVNVAQTSMQLVKGWNLVGYPALDVRNVSDVIAPISSSVTNVTAYNKSAETFISYPGGGLSTFVPGRGHWVNTTTGVTWTVFG